MSSFRKGGNLKNTANEKMTTYTDYTQLQERETFTFVETYSMCEIYKNSKGEFLLSTERFKRFPKTFATLNLAKTAITKRYTAINNVYARNYVKQN